MTQSSLTKECMSIFADFVLDITRKTRDMSQDDKDRAIRYLSGEVHFKHLSTLTRHHFDCTDAKISSSDEQKKRCGETFARLILNLPARLGYSTVVSQNFEHLPNAELANFKETMRSNRVIFKNAALKYCMEDQRANDIESMSLCFKAFRAFDELHDLV